MAAITYTEINDSVRKTLQNMIDSGGGKTEAFLQNYVYLLYLETQKKRWAQINVDADFIGGEWPQLKNKKDEEYKRKKYASYIGGGEQLMVRKGTLYNSIVNPGDQNHEKIIAGGTMRINTLVKYAKYLDAGTEKMEARVFSGFSDIFKNSILTKYKTFITGDAI